MHASPSPSPLDRMKAHRAKAIEFLDKLMARLPKEEWYDQNTTSKVISLLKEDIDLANDMIKHLEGHSD
jgi:hypothetical protein